MNRITAAAAAVALTAAFTACGAPAEQTPDQPKPVCSTTSAAHTADIQQFIDGHKVTPGHTAPAEKDGFSYISVKYSDGHMLFVVSRNGLVAAVNGDARALSTAPNASDMGFFTESVGAKVVAECDATA